MQINDKGNLVKNLFDSFFSFIKKVSKDELEVFANISEEDFKKLKKKIKKYFKKQKPNNTFLRRMINHKIFSNIFFEFVHKKPSDKKINESNEK